MMTDDKRHNVLIASNNDKRSLQQMTNFHLATLCANLVNENRSIPPLNLYCRYVFEFLYS